MKRKLILIGALFPLLALTACGDSNDAKLKKQEEALKTYKKSVEENLTDEQKAKQEVYRRALSGTKIPKFMEAPKPNAPTGNAQP